MKHHLKFKVVSNLRNRPRENRKLVPLDLTSFGYKKYGIWVGTSQQIIDCESPCTVGKFPDLMVSFNIYRKVHPEIIRYAISVSVTIKNAFGSFYLILGNRHRDGTARIVNYIP